MRKLIAKVTKESPVAKDPRKPACCVTLRRESVAKAILKKPKPAKAKHGVAKASRKGPRKQVYRTAFYTRVFGTAQLVCFWFLRQATVAWCLASVRWSLIWQTDQSGPLSTMRWPVECCSHGRFWEPCPLDPLSFGQLLEFAPRATGFFFAQKGSSTFAPVPYKHGPEKGALFTSARQIPKAQQQCS